MRLFKGVRIFSHVESVIFASLLVVWLGNVDDRAQFVLGMTHGIGWCVLCGLIYIGCLRRVFPWTMLAAVVLLMPFGSSAGIEWMRRRGKLGPALEGSGRRAAVRPRAQAPAPHEANGAPAAASSAPALGGTPTVAAASAPPRSEAGAAPPG